MAAVCMFLFKRGSRNAMNQISVKQSFVDNYYKLFGMDCPHMDACEDFFRNLSPDCLEQIKHRMIKLLLEKKSLHKFRLLGLYHIIAIDGVCVCSYDYEPYPGCPFRQSRSGDKKWLVNVIEAKLVYSNGFSISVASEHVINEDGYQKQDCEQKAAIRLLNTIKRLFPCLPVCIAADGLYTSQTIFQLCKDFQWKYIITLKDNCLESVWKEVRVELFFQWKNRKVDQLLDKHKWHFSRYRFVLNIPFRNKFKMNWVECFSSVYNKKNKKNTVNRFVHITNMDINLRNVKEISDGGRLRWKIENQGFNDQKNHGYCLSHKFSRHNINAIKNYYQCLQIAHIIAQLCIKCKAVNDFKGKLSIKTIWEDMIAELRKVSLDEFEIENILCLKCQFRF